MSRYRRVSVRMWGDEKFRRLSPPKPCGQSLWIYLLSGDHTSPIPGLFVAGQAQLAEALGWPMAGFRRAFAEVEREGMAIADWTARVVWLPNALKHNPPSSPNVVTGWLEALAEIPECSLKRAAIHGMRDYLKGLSEGFQEAFEKGFPEGFPKQEEEKDKEEDKETTHVPGSAGGDVASSNGHQPSEETWGTPEALVALYNRLAPPGHPQVTRLTPARRHKARQYLAAFPDQKFWNRAFSELRFSAFLRGLKPSQGHEHFRGDFDWLLTKGKDGTENIAKVAEGKYRGGVDA